MSATAFLPFSFLDIGPSPENGRAEVAGVLQGYRRGSEDRVNGFRSCGSWSFFEPRLDRRGNIALRLMVPKASLC